MIKKEEFGNEFKDCSLRVKILIISVVVIGVVSVYKMMGIGRVIFMLIGTQLFYLHDSGKL